MSNHNLTGERRKVVRRALYLSQRGRCFWCDRKILIQDATLDHVLPVSKGGTNHQHNLVVACEPCNSRRGNSDPPHVAGRTGGQNLAVEG